MNFFLSTDEIKQNGNMEKTEREIGRELKF